MACGARVKHTGLCQSGQDVNLLMGVVISTWNLNLIRGTMEIVIIRKIRNQQQWLMIAPLVKRNFYSCEINVKGAGRYRNLLWYKEGNQ